jgi:hypothetical protein
MKQICFLCRPYGYGVLGQQTTIVKKDSKTVVFILRICVHNNLHGRIHVVVNVLSRLPDNSEPLGVPDKTMDASLFFVKPIWMQEVKTYLEIG